MTCDDDDVGEALKALVVGRIGLMSYPTRVVRADLARYVAKHPPARLLAQDWIGAEAASVQVRSITIEAAQLIDKAAADLKAELSKNYASVEVRSVSHLDAVRLPIGEAKLVTRLPRPQGDTLRAGRRMRVEVEVTQEREVVRKVPLWFEVRAFAPGWVARTDLPAGQVLAAGDTETREVDWAQAGGDTTARESDVIGQRLRRPLRAGEPLRRSLVEAVPQVQRGDAVALQIRSGAVLIQANGTALADGRQGRDVPVKLDGARHLRGRVTGPGSVDMEHYR